MKIYEGLKINYLTVLQTKSDRINGIQYNLCRCECGNERYVHRSTLRTASIQDCGCGRFMLDKCVGLKFGKLTVVSARKDTNRKGTTICHCICECGNESDVPLSALKAGQSRSCGCQGKFDFSKYKDKIYNGNKIVELIDSEKKTILCECSCGNKFTCRIFDLTCQKSPILNCGKCGIALKEPVKAFRKHRVSRLENIYYKMIDRCTNSKEKSYRNYGGRGIKVCDEWKQSFKNFRSWALANGYQEDLTIDRIDVNGNYEPSNCRWATRKEQANNTRRTKKYNFNGDLYSITEIAEMTKINPATFRDRIKRGMDIDTAISTPIRRR